MLIPCRLEPLMKPTASSAITDVLVREDRFIAENYLQGNSISKTTFMHDLHNSILNSRTDTSKCWVHKVQIHTKSHRKSLTTKILLPFLKWLCWIVPTLVHFVICRAFSLSHTLKFWVYNFFKVLFCKTNYLFERGYTCHFVHLLKLHKTHPTDCR